MSIEAPIESPESKELSLVGKLELRIALVDSDTKLESILKTYLPPLLLKLASDHLTVRNKVRQEPTYCELPQEVIDKSTDIEVSDSCVPWQCIFDTVWLMIFWTPRLFPFVNISILGLNHSMFRLGFLPSKMKLFFSINASCFRLLRSSSEHLLQY